LRSYLICRFSRFMRPIIFMEWNYRTRYLFRNMCKIIGKLLSIFTILGVFIFVFAALGFFLWSSPVHAVSSFPGYFTYFRTFIRSVLTMATLTTTENYPNCMNDYMAMSFVNFFFFLFFILLSIFFALNVVLSTVYDAYEENLKTYYNTRLYRDRRSIAYAFEHLCDANKQLSRARWRAFIRVYNGLDHLDPAVALNSRRLQRCDISADFMFSVCCIKRRFVRCGV
jgi:hypothetical protein